MEFRTVIKVDAFHDYMEILFVFIIIFTGTYTYTVDNWISPFVLFLYGIMIGCYAVFSYFICRSLAKKEDDFPLYKIVRTIDAAVVWGTWLIYGTVFRNIGPPFSSVPIVGHSLGVMTFALVLLTYYWNHVNLGAAEDDHDDDVGSLNGNPSTKKSAIILFTAVLMLIPHSKTSYHSTSSILFAKVAVFYLLYLLTEFYQVLQRKYERLNAHVTTAKEDKNWLYKLELKVVQTAWVLLVSEYLIGAFVLQLIPLCNQIWWYLKRVHDVAQFLPTTSPIPVKKRKKKKKRDESRDGKKHAKIQTQKPKKKRTDLIPQPPQKDSSSVPSNTNNGAPQIVHSLEDTSSKELRAILNSKINIVQVKEKTRKNKSGTSASTNKNNKKKKIKKDNTMDSI